jgi:capsular polysaccharide biosynthesis protein
MSQSAPDPQRSPQVIRRYGILVGITAMVGLLAGAVTAAAFSPVIVTSTALVVLPQVGQNAAAAAGGEPDPFTVTQEVIAESNPVLAGALPDVRPAMSLTELRHDIQIGGPTSYVISISAKGKTAGDAEATANAVARSYIQYIGSVGSPAGRMQAEMLQPAVSATGTAPLMRLLLGAMLGTVSGVLTGVIAALVSRRPALAPPGSSWLSGI